MVIDIDELILEGFKHSKIVEKINKKEKKKMKKIIKKGSYVKVKNGFSPIEYGSQAYIKIREEIDKIDKSYSPKCCLADNDVYNRRKENAKLKVYSRFIVRINGMNKDICLVRDMNDNDENKYSWFFYTGYLYNSSDEEPKEEIKFGEEEKVIPNIDENILGERIAENVSNQLKDTTDRLNEEIKNLKNQLEKKDDLKLAMIEAIIEKGKELSVKDIEEQLKSNLDKFIEEKYGILPKTIRIEKEDNKKEIKGIFHKKFEQICKLVDKNIPLMLTGPAGSGKNYTLEQVAEALDLNFYFSNSVNQEYKLTGFIDANGKYHETEFYKAFVNGGLFFLDEVDASSPEALIILNSAIANKYFDFPTGRIIANENFRVVCAGNTYGTGADMVYVGRNVLDGATLDRFVVVKFDYDNEVEKQLAYDEELYDFIISLRKSISEAGLRYIVSMRALINATKMLEIGIDKKIILKDAIIKNMQIDDLNNIVNKINSSNEWVRILKEVSREL